MSHPLEHLPGYYIRLILWLLPDLFSDFLKVVESNKDLFQTRSILKSSSFRIRRTLSPKLMMI